MTPTRDPDEMVNEILSAHDGYFEIALETSEWALHWYSFNRTSRPEWSPEQIMRFMVEARYVEDPAPEQENAILEDLARKPHLHNMVLSILKNEQTWPDHPVVEFKVFADSLRYLLERGPEAQISDAVIGGEFGDKIAAKVLASVRRGRGQVQSSKEEATSSETDDLPVEEPTVDLGPIGQEPFQEYLLQLLNKDPRELLREAIREISVAFGNPPGRTDRDQDLESFCNKYCVEALFPYSLNVMMLLSMVAPLNPTHQSMFDRVIAEAWKGRYSLLPEPEYADALFSTEVRRRSLGFAVLHLVALGVQKSPAKSIPESFGVKKSWTGRWRTE